MLLEVDNRKKFLNAIDYSGAEDRDSTLLVCDDGDEQHFVDIEQALIPVECLQQVDCLQDEVQNNTQEHLPLGAERSTSFAGVPVAGQLSAPEEASSSYR